MPLRPPQIAAVDATVKSLAEYKSSFCCMATGMGKTCVKSNVILHYLSKGRVLVVANSSVLTFQLAREIARWTGEEVDIEKAEYRSNEVGIFERKKIIVGSIQSLISAESPIHGHKYRPARGWDSGQTGRIQISPYVHFQSFRC